MNYPQKCLAILSLILLSLTATAPAAGPPGISDAFVDVDGTPITVGRLNLLLKQRFGNSVNDPAAARDPAIAGRLRQAAALMLVRQQLAMISLEKMGGAGLIQQLDQTEANVMETAEKRGVSLRQQAAASDADEDALLADVRWKAAWGAYLKSTLTDAALKTYYNRNAAKYGGKPYDEFADMNQLKSDATSTLFNELVRRSAAAPITWYDSALEPPDGYSVTP